MRLWIKHLYQDAKNTFGPHGLNSAKQLPSNVSAPNIMNPHLEITLVKTNICSLVKTANDCSPRVRP